MSRINSIEDIVRWRQCLGCGACAYICPEQKIQLENIVAEGIRPTISDSGSCQSCEVCLEVCPAHHNDFTEAYARPGIVPELTRSSGPVLEIWEGHASDPQIRWQGSSGGALTALSLFCIERAGMHGVLHVGQDAECPILNRTWLSRSRAELMARTGSRYAPASVCDRLDWIEEAPRPCVFIGQPSEVTALRKAQALRPELNRKVGLVLSFFCAGSPSSLGTLELLRRMEIPPDRIGELRYRGNGWPGMFAARVQPGEIPLGEMTYRESWAFLQAFRPYSAHLWPDGAGELADISCGDPWYRKVEPGEPGSSLIVTRTALGRQLLQEAAAAGYLEIAKSTPERLIESQINLVNKRRAVWGRQLAFRLAGLPATTFRGMPLFQAWNELPWSEKLRSIFGTLVRIFRRNYRRPLNLETAARFDAAKFKTSVSSQPVAKIA